MRCERCRTMCEVVWRCDGHGEGVKDVRKVCQLMERCDTHGRNVQKFREVTVVRKCDSHRGGVKGIRRVCQLMERYDSHVGGVKGCGAVWHLSVWWGFIWQSLGKCEFEKYLPVFHSSSFYQKIHQTMKIQEIPRKIQGFRSTLNFFEISWIWAWFVGFPWNSKLTVRQNFELGTSWIF